VFEGSYDLIGKGRILYDYNHDDYRLYVPRTLHVNIDRL